ncbi:MAG TPA: hypothetical protein DCE42_06930 [Myxococcales bacterium]|nr:hypothetical protein [Deltaproteobacteria bacterium]MBU53534.1 hypothetical protein [Deltaproteobacteria bacterium]HAA54472.1 hypothetical protein [Myxococcales bacterium]
MSHLTLRGGRVSSTSQQPSRYGFQLWQTQNTRVIIPLNQHKKPEFKPPRGAKLITEVVG